MKASSLKTVCHATLLFLGLANLQATRCAAGQVVAWGDNSYGQTNVPPGLTNVLALAGGFSHSLALMSNGTVVGWGDDTYGQTNTPVDLTNAVAIAAGWYHSMALRSDGTVTAWGAGMLSSGVAPDFGQSAVPSDLSNVVAIAAGQFHSMALRADGTLRVWGDNSHGETNVPIDLTNAIAIAAGSNFCVALRADGTVRAWGDNGSHQTNAPTLKATAIAAGGSYCLAIKRQGMVTAWGSQTRVPAALIAVAPIISANAGTTETNASKNAGLDGNVAVDAIASGPTVIYASTNAFAILANSRVNLSTTNTSVIDIAPNSISMTNFAADTLAPDYTTIPDYTIQGKSNTLFDINRFIAVADATTNGFAASGNNHFLNLSNFLAVAKNHGPSNPLEGVIAVDIFGGSNTTSGIQGADPYLNRLTAAALPNGMNIKGSLVFNFTGEAWELLGTSYKAMVAIAININPADLSHLVASNPATYTTGYPPTYQNPSFNPTNIDITGITNPATGLTDFQNFTPEDTIPAFIGTIGVADLHGALNISGVMYTPSYMEVENKSANQTQYVRGSLIMGNGVYFENDYASSTSVFSGNPQPIAIAARGANNLALMADGSVFTWGGVAPAPSGLTNVMEIAAGVSHSLALVGDGSPLVLSNAPPSNVIATTNGFSFSMPSQNGRVYSMEYSDSLTNGNWAVVSLAAGNGGMLTLSDSTAADAARFYRVRQW